MPLPFALDHINLWLIEDTIEAREGWTLIDCGIDSAPTRAIWNQVLQNELMGKPILRIIATHMHPDHLGNAHWLSKEFGAPLWMNPTEFYASHCARASNSGFGGTAVAAFMASHGLIPAHWIETIQNRSNTYAQMVPNIPMQFIGIHHKDLIQMGGHEWECIKGHGHSPEHISLYCKERHVLISGDMLLPKISTNVSVWASEPLSNPVQQFLDSLQLLSGLPERTLVCPSHGIPFQGAEQRICELTLHHRERLDEVLDACTQSPQSAFDITKVMFKRELDLHQITFAMGEALAHLHWWWHKGSLKRIQGTDHIYRFHALDRISA